jgi:hypothetical protein
LAVFALASIAPADAERYYKQARAIREAALPIEHPYRVKLLQDFAALLTASGRSAEAADLRRPSACSSRKTRR